jgi:hypothetical protein
MINYSIASLSIALTAVSLAWLFYFIHFRKAGSGGIIEAAGDAFIMSIW